MKIIILQFYNDFTIILGGDVGDILMRQNWFFCI